MSLDSAIESTVTRHGTRSWGDHKDQPGLQALLCRDIRGAFLEESRTIRFSTEGSTSRLVPEKTRGSRCAMANAKDDLGKLNERPVP